MAPAKASWEVETPSLHTNEEIDDFIKRRLTETGIDYASYVRVIRNPLLEQQLREKIKNFADFANRMEPYRERGLVHLQNSRISASRKKGLLDLQLEKVMHEVATCLDHFLGVHDILMSWGHPEKVASVGLYHAVYGTEFNPITTLDPVSDSDREWLSAIVGRTSERWIHLYGTFSSDDFITRVGAEPDARSVVLASGEELSRKDIAVLSDVLVANSYQPFYETGEKDILVRLRQFEPLRPHLSRGAREALDVGRVLVG